MNVLFRGILYVIPIPWNWFYSIQQRYVNLTALRKTSAQLITINTVEKTAALHEPSTGLREVEVENELEI